MRLAVLLVSLNTPQPACSKHTERYQSTKLTKRTASPVPNTETSVDHCFFRAYATHYALS